MKDTKGQPIAHMTTKAILIAKTYKSNVTCWLRRKQLIDDTTYLDNGTSSTDAKTCSTPELSSQDTDYIPQYLLFMSQLDTVHHPFPCI